MFLETKKRGCRFQCILWISGWVLLTGQIGCTPVVIPKGQVVDMTYAFDAQTLYWPHNKPFQWEKTSWGLKHTEGYWYASGIISGSNPSFKPHG